MAILHELLVDGTGPLFVAGREAPTLSQDLDEIAPAMRGGSSAGGELDPPRR